MRIIHLCRKMRNNKLFRSVMICAVAVLAFKTHVLHSFLITFVIPVITNMEEYEPFEPEVFTDLDFETDGVPKIERNIHQTWKDINIPSQFVDNVKSFVDNNPSWKYYFWTDESARQLIVDHYPHLLPVWDGVPYSTYPIRRADALRYVVLHRYGGIYADLDMINYRSLETAITKHSCVFTPEPYEHAVFRSYSPYLLSNAVIMCASNHPFLKRLIDNLFSTEFYTNSVDSTGPGYVTTQFSIHNDLPKPEQHFKLYHKRSIDPLVDNSPYMDKGSIYPLTHRKSVYIANTRYFLYTLDKNVYSTFILKCPMWDFLDHLHRRACLNAQVLGLNRKRHKFAFTEHQWYMTWINWKSSIFFPFRLFSQSSVNLSEIVPNPVIYSR